MNKRRFSVRNRKRQLLQLAIMLASPVVTCHLTSDISFADSPTQTTQRLLPPQTTNAFVDGASGKAMSSKPQANPFCQPAPTDSATTSMSMPQFGFMLPNQSPVQLTSNQDEVIPERSQPDTLVQPVQVAPKRNQWKAPVDAAIQAKPIHANRDALTFGAGTDPSKDNPVVDGAVSFNPAHPVPMVPAADQARPVEAKQAPSAAPVHSLPNLPALPAPVHTDGKSQHSKPSSTASTYKSKADGAVSFSLDDDTLVETSVEAAKPTSQKSTTAASAKSASEKPSFAPMLSHGANESVPPVVVTRSKSVPVLPASVPLPSRNGMSNNTIKSNQFANDAEVVIDRGSNRVKTHLVPLAEPETVRPVAIQATPDRRIVRGGRPAVDVGRPPVMIERNTAASGPLVASVADLNPANASKYAFDKAFESDNVVVMDLKCTEVRALKLEHAISKVQVGDSKVCAALAAGPSQVQLIGASDGVTRLAVWTSNSAGQETKSVYEIRVGQPKSNDANSPQSVANQLTKTVQAAFPDSKLIVRAQDEQLIVEGVCSNDESAKKAIRMIRSACLMPVVDKVVIR